MRFKIGDCVILTKDYPFSGGVIRRNSHGIIHSDGCDFDGIFFYSVWFEEYNFSPIVNEDDLIIC